MSINPSKSRVPALTHHKATGQGVVRLNGKDFYLGKFGSDECLARYNEKIAEFTRCGRQILPKTADLIVNELVAAYIEYAAATYQKGGEPTSQVALIGAAIRECRLLCGPTFAREFGPKKLKAVRQRFVDSGLCRREVNRRTRIVIQMFKWAASEEMVPGSVHVDLSTVEGLRKGKTSAPDHPKIKPVDLADVEAVKPHVSRQVAAMVSLQQFTGMRPGEVSIMRTIDIDMSGDDWIYTPESHKCEHHEGQERHIVLGPEAREILKPWLRADQQVYLFSPAEAEAERRDNQRAARKTPVQPSQVIRGRKKAKIFGVRYSRLSYAQAIERGCDKAFPHPELDGVRDQYLSDDQKADLLKWRKAHRFAPNRIRHTYGTAVRKEYGLEAVAAVLGHAKMSTSEIYAEQDMTLATKVARKMG